jgi:hypothetical protein
VRRVVVLPLALIACSHDEVAPPVASPLEATIGKALGARFGVAVIATCTTWQGTPLACGAVLADGPALVIRVRDVGPEWEWWIEGDVVATAPIAAYIRDELADLGAAQEVRCGPSARLVGPGERIDCALGGGGKAFATLAHDGTVTVELALDPAAAAARSEPAQGLEQRSRALNTSDDNDDEAAPADAGGVVR